MVRPLLTVARQVTGFLAAVQFLTRVPVRLERAPDHGRAVPWFPVVGALLGATTGAVAAGLMELVPPSVAAAVAIMLGVALTGAFHEDGLADTADALGGYTPERRREILEDSRHGSFGVAAMCGTILLRTLCVATLAPAAAFAGLVAAHTLGRGAAIAVMASARPVPAAGLGADYTRAVSGRGAIIGIAAALAIAALATGWWALPLALGAGLAALMVTNLAVRAFEGVGGDALGATEQLAEIVALIVVSGLAARHGVWWRA